MALAAQPPLLFGRRQGHVVPVRSRGAVDDQLAKVAQLTRAEASGEAPVRNHRYDS